jgi:ribosomal protein S18 acetylase RimI-like enzyme
MSNHKIRNVIESDLDRCFEIERVSYEGDEAATREKIRKRILRYPEGFIVVELSGMVVGFINCGATDNIDLANEEFKDLIGHDSNGEYAVIFSVVVHRDYQGKGFAGMLLTDFIFRIKKMQKKSIYLICRDNLIDFYKKFGFKYIRKSDSTHGGLVWHEMVLSL